MRHIGPNVAARTARRFDRSLESCELDAFTNDLDVLPDRYLALPRFSYNLSDLESFRCGTAVMIGYAIDVDTRELTKVLKRLRKMEKTEPLVYLRYVPGKLTISLGNTADELQATGIWSSLVSAPARWVTALATTPIKAAITDLRVHDGRLWARDFGVVCTVHEGEEATTNAIVRKKTKRARA